MIYSPPVCFLARYLQLYFPLPDAEFSLLYENVNVIIQWNINNNNTYLNLYRNESALHHQFDPTTCKITFS